MEVEFTARQGKITKALRTQAEEGLERIGKLLGKTATASVVFSVERHLQVVELNLKARSQKIAASGKGPKQDAALKQALEHAENQVLRARDRRLSSKRLPTEDKVAAAPPVSRTKTRATQPREEPPVKVTKARARTVIPVHTFPAAPNVVEPHILKSSQAIAIKPMTVEEAVKELEFRDRDLLIFRTSAGATIVLHRRRDGQVELVEMP
jgi:putative sigma-54 modulation protein